MLCLPAQCRITHFTICPYSVFFFSVRVFNLKKYTMNNLRVTSYTIKNFISHIVCENSVRVMIFHFIHTCDRHMGSWSTYCGSTTQTNVSQRSHRKSSPQSGPSLATTLSENSLYVSFPCRKQLSVVIHCIFTSSLNTCHGAVTNEGMTNNGTEICTVSYLNFSGRIKDGTVMK